MKQFPFKELLVIALVIFLSGCNKGGNKNDDPLNSHNGISFDMTQKDVEAIGFICEQRVASKANMLCHHMNMTGVAFGFPTKNYGISIGSSGKVYSIFADVNSLNKASDYFSLESKIKIFYPKETKHEPIGDASAFAIFGEWEAKNNASVRLLFMKGAPPILEDELSITFFSPH